jgi:hypothetical protein
MRTLKQIETSRRNALKSTGPRTPEGKNRSKYNALKHGRYAKTLTFFGEDAETFQRRFDLWFAALRAREKKVRGSTPEPEAGQASDYRNRRGESPHPSGVG